MPKGARTGRLRETAPVGLVLQLEVKQQQLRLKHKEFAGLLGIHYNYWYRLRSGDRPVTMALVARVLRLWGKEFEPFLAEAALARPGLGSGGTWPEPPDDAAGDAGDGAGDEPALLRGRREAVLVGAG